MRVKSLLCVAVILLGSIGSAQAGVITLDLGASGAGTFFEGASFTPWTLGALPSGAILKSVAIDATIESDDNGNWAAELAVLFKNSATNANLLAIGPYYMADDYMTPGVVSPQNAYWANGYNGPVTTVKDKKYAGLDFSLDSATAIDLSSVNAFLVNTYGGPPTGGTWSGTIKLNYVVAGPTVTWTGGTSEWSTNPVTNWTDGVNAVPFVTGNQVVFDNSVGAGSKIVDISVADVSPADVLFNNDLANTYTLTGTKAITGETGLTKLGNGLLIVANANTYTGLTRIGEGTLQLGRADALPQGADKDVVLLSGTLDLGGFSPTLNGLVGPGRVTNSAPGNAKLTLGAGAADSSFSGLIENGNGIVALEKIGAGTLRINGNANTYTGKTSVLAGTLDIGPNAYLSNAGVAGPLGAPVGADAVIDIYSGATLHMGNTNPRRNQSTDRTINLAGDGPGTVSIRVNDNDTSFTFGPITATGIGPKTLALYTGADGNGDREVVTLNGPISDGVDSQVGLQINYRTQTGSSSTVNLNGQNTFTGPITVASVVNATTTYLNIGSTALLGYDSGTGAGNYAGNIAIHPTTILNFANSADQILAGVISGGGALNKSGAGILTLSGANTISGPIAITAGTLRVTGSLGTGNAVSVGPAGTLVVTPTATIARDVNVGGGAVNLAGSLTSGATLKLSGGTVVTAAGAPSVPVADFSAGAGTVTADTPLAITNTLKLPAGVVATYAPGGSATSFTVASVAGSNVGNNSAARTFTLSGGTLNLFAPNAPANLNQYTYRVVTGADSGISSANTYTHAIDFGGGGNGDPVANPINGVTFQNYFGSATMTGSQNAGAATAGNEGNFNGNIPAGTYPGLYNLYNDFRFGAGTNNVVLTGLTPGGYYETRLYCRTWGGTGDNRRQQFDAYIGDSTTSQTTWTVNEDNPLDGGNTPEWNALVAANGGFAQGTAWAMGYVFQADAAGKFTLKAQQVGDGSLHVYGLTNQVVAGGGAGVVNFPNSNFAVTASSTLDLGNPAADHVLGDLTLSGASSALALSGGNSVSFNSIAATDNTSIGGLPIVLRTGNATVSSGKKLSVSSSIIDGAAPAALTILGGGTVELAASNGYTGQTNINQGTLALGAAGSIDSSSAIVVGALGTLDVSAKSLFAVPASKTLTNNGTVRGNVSAPATTTLAGAGSFLRGGSGPYGVTVGGTIRPGNGGGTMTIGAVGSEVDLNLLDNSVYEWGVNADGTCGLIQVNGNVSFGAGVKVFPLNLGGIPDGKTFTIMNWTGSDSGSIPTLSLPAPNTSTTYNWAVSSGEWENNFNWDHTAFAGGTIAKVAKSLQLNGLTATASGPGSASDVVIAPAGGAAVTPSWSGARSVASLSLGNGIDATSLSVAPGTTLNVAAAATLNHNATLTGPGTLAAASLNVPAANTATIGGGATALINSAAVSGTLNFNNGILKAAAASDDFITGGGTVAIKSGGATINTNGNAVTLKKAMTTGVTGGSDGGFVKAGDGVLTLTAAQTYTGSTAITGGTLRLINASPAPGATLWLNASDSSKMTFGSGNAITAWANSAGDTGAVTGNGTYTLDAINGQPVVHFNNSQYMSNNVNYASPITIFAVDRTTGGSNQRVIAGAGNNWLFGNWGGRMDQAYFDGWVSDNGNGPGADTIPHMYEATIGGPGVNSTFYVYDTRNPAIQQIGSNQNGTTGPNGLQLNGYQGGNELSDADVAEVLIYSGILSDADRAKTEAYLMGKYWGASGAGISSGALPTTTAVTMSSNTTFDLNGAIQQIGSLSDAVPGGTTGHQVFLGGGTLKVGDATSTTFSGAISGGGWLTKVGSGTLTLSGVNTHTGGISINEGILAVGNDTALGATGPAGATLKFAGGTFQSTAPIATNRPVTVAAAGGTVDTGSSNHVTFSGAISGTGPLTKIGDGTLSLIGTSTLSGPTNVIGGKVVTNAAGLAGPVVLSNNTNVTFDQGVAGTYKKVISGNGSLTKAGDGTLTISGAQTYSGPTLINGGTLQLQVVNGYRYYKFQVTGSQGGGTDYQVSEIAFYSSGKNPTDGTRVAPTGAFGDGKDYNDQGIPGLYDNNVGTKAYMTNGWPRWVTFDFGTSQAMTGYDWASANDSIEYGRNPSNWSVLASNDNSDWTTLDTRTGLGGSVTSNYTYAPGWLLPAMSGKGTNLLPSTTAVVMASNATLDLNGVDQQIVSLSDDMPGGSNRNVVNSSTAFPIALTLSSNGGPTAFSGVIGGGGGVISLVKDGTATQTLSGANTYTGSTTISGGTLQIVNGGSIGGTSGITVNSTGTLDVSALSTPFTLAGGKQLMLGGGTVKGNLVVNGILAGNGSMVGSAAGQTVTINGTISPGTYATAAATDGIGTLTVGDSQGMGLTLGATSVYNWGLGAGACGRIDVNGALTVASGAKVVLNNGGVVPTGNYTILTWTDGAAPAAPSLEFASPPAGTTVNWTGAAVPADQAWTTGNNWDLGGFSGGSIVQVGNSFQLQGLTLSYSAPLATSAVIIAPESGVAVNGPSAGITTVQSLVLGRTSGSTVSSLNVQGSNDFRVTGATTVNSQGALAVSGSFTTSSLATGGTVSVTGALTAPSVVVNGGETTFAGGAAVSVNTLSVNGGTLRVADGGQLGTGGVTLGSGTLQLTGSAFNSTKAVTINGGSIDVPNTATIAGVIGGSAPLTKTGAGTLIVTGASNTFSSAVVDAGTLQGSVASVKTNVAVSAASANMIFDQATGNDATYKKVVSGSGNLAKVGGGVLTIGKAQTYLGNTTISGGTLKLAAQAEPFADASLNLWLDAANDGSLAVNSNGTGGTPALGGIVQRWTSLVGTNYASNASSAATYQTDAQSGNPVLRFNGNDGNALSFANQIASDGSTVFIMFKSSDVNNWTQPLQSNLHLTDGDRGGVNRCLVTGGGWMRIQGDSIPSTREWHVQEMQIKSGDFALWVDNNLMGTSNAQGGLSNFTNVGGNFPGDIGEVLIYNRNLTAEERTATFDYLNEKWLGAGGGGPGSNLLPITTAVTMAAGTTLDLNGVSQQIASLSDATGATGHQVLLGSGTLTVGNANSTAFSGAISGTGSVTKVGSGTLTLSGVNSHSGATAINEGKLVIGQGGSMGTATSVSVASGATYGLSQTVSGPVSAGGSLAMVEGATLDLQDAAFNTLSFNTSGTATGGLTGVNLKLDLGASLTQYDKVTFGGSSNFTGKVNFSFNTFSSLENGTYFIVSAPSGLAGECMPYLVGDSVRYGHNLSLELNAERTAIVLNISGAVVETGAYWAPVAGGGGSGSWTAASTTWAAGPGVQGTLPQSTTSPLVFAGAAGTVTIGSGGVSAVGLTFDTAGYTIAGDPLTLTGAATVAANQDATINAVIAGSAGLAKSGAGTLLLTAANTYTGTTAISGGTLQVGNGGSGATLGSGMVLLSNNAKLAFNHADAIAISQLIGGTGSVTKSGTGTLTLTGSNYYTGATTITAGTVVLGVDAQYPVLGGAGVDLQHGKIVFDAGDATVIKDLLTASYNATEGKWLGGQFKSTTASATGLTLGWKEDVVNGNVTVMATFVGDANVDGSVDGIDLDIWKANVGSSTATFAMADLNYDGSVDGLDLDLWKATVGSSGAGGSAASAPVPEPGTLALLAMGLLGLLAWRRRR